MTQRQPAKRRVLITGGTGFVGRNCLPDLVAQGDEVHAVSSSDRHFGLNGVTWHHVNLLEPTAAQELVKTVRPTHLLHLAWETTHGRFWTSSDNLRWLVASVELFHAFADHGGQRAVIAGTCAEYRPTDKPCAERATPVEPRTLYTACKHALHIAAREHAAQTGVSLAWGRVFFLYGPDEKAGRLVPSVVLSLLAGEPAACSHGRQVRDFLYVQDAANAFTAMLRSDVTGPINVGSGVATTVAEVADAIGEIIGTPELVRLGAIPTGADDAAFLVADVHRLTDEVGWRPKHDLLSGLRQTVEWWRKPVTT